jgi:hypothetical protein
MNKPNLVSDTAPIDSVVTLTVFEKYGNSLSNCFKTAMTKNKGFRNCSKKSFCRVWKSTGFESPSLLPLLGIGLETVRQLCQKLSGKDDAVILTSRNPDLGQQALKDLEKEGDKKFCLLFRKIMVVDPGGKKTKLKLYLVIFSKFYNKNVCCGSGSGLR